MEYMDDNRYGVGIDIGTGSVKVVVGVCPRDSAENNESILPNIIGVGMQPSAGIRKGIITDIAKVSRVLDKALSQAEQMSGQAIHHATFSVNGTKITGIQSRGVVAVNGDRQTIGSGETERVIKAAQVVKLAPNQIILNASPRTYKVDNQDGIRDPIGMTGVRLEVDAFVTTALSPQLRNIDSVASNSSIEQSSPCIPAGVASSSIALNDQQKENGAASLDIGHSTTTLVVYDEGDIVDIKVLPIGSNNITSDLAIGLQTDLDIAEQVKIQHAVAAPQLRRGNEEMVAIKVAQPDGSVHKIGFKTELIDTIVATRLAELFELVNKELKRIHRAGALPGGIMITGGGAKLRGITDFSRMALQINTHAFAPQNYQMVSKLAADPSFTAAIGLMEQDLSQVMNGPEQGRRRSSNRGSGIFAKLFHFGK